MKTVHRIMFNTNPNISRALARPLSACLRLTTQTFVVPSSFCLKLEITVLVTSFLMLGLQLAASDLEDPFGYDLSDLELDLVRIENRRRERGHERIVHNSSDTGAPLCETIEVTAGVIWRCGNVSGVYAQVPHVVERVVTFGYMS